MASLPCSRLLAFLAGGALLAVLGGSDAPARAARPLAGQPLSWPMASDGGAGLALIQSPSARQDGLYQVPYNGLFTFTRLRYRSGSSWNHDYPAADRNMQLILNEFTHLRSNANGSNVLDLEDPRIFQHPILYMSEPGFWTVSEEGAGNLRNFLLKGGFLMFDDFELDQWYNMAAQMRKALPGYDWVEIDESHPIFRSFFGVLDIYVPHPLVAVIPIYRVIFEDNDPTKRIMVLANHNSDLAEYWEWSASNAFGVDMTNDAYRLGTNYIVYAMIH